MLLNVAATSLFSAAGVQAAARVQVPSECGAQPEFEREVQGRLGNSAEFPATWVVIVPDGAQYRLSMQVGAERREFRDPDCRALFHAAIVVTVAIATGTAVSLERPITETTPPPRAEQEQMQMHAKDESALRFGVGAGVGLNLGLMPSAALALELDTTLAWQSFGAALAVQYIPRSSTRDDTGHGVEVQAWGGQISATWEPSPLIQLRVGGFAYRLSGSGLGSASNSSDAVWGAGPHAGLMVVPVRRGGFWFGAGADVQLHLLRPSFEILEYGEVFQTSPAGVSILLRVGQFFF